MISETEEGYYHQKPNVKRRKSENPERLAFDGD